MSCFWNLRKSDSPAPMNDVIVPDFEKRFDSDWAALHSIKESPSISFCCLYWIFADCIRQKFVMLVFALHNSHTSFKKIVPYMCYRWWRSTPFVACQWGSDRTVAVIAQVPNIWENVLYFTPHPYNMKNNFSTHKHGFLKLSNRLEPNCWSHFSAWS